MKSVARWLEENKPEVVAQIVQRIYEELPDYRQRPVDQLTAAAGTAYDQWCHTVLEDDLMRYAREAEAVIEQTIARGVDVRQLSRVPLLICAVVVAMLEQAGSAVDPEELALFQDCAQRMTTTIVGIGNRRIARGVLKKAVDESFVRPTGPADLPGS